MARLLLLLILLQFLYRPGYLASPLTTDYVQSGTDSHCPSSPRPALCSSCHSNNISSRFCPIAIHYHIFQRHVPPSILYDFLYVTVHLLLRVHQTSQESLNAFLTSFYCVQCSICFWQLIRRLISFTRIRLIHRQSKKGATLTMAVTSSVLDRFAKFFHCCKEH